MINSRLESFHYPIFITLLVYNFANIVYFKDLLCVTLAFFQRCLPHYYYLCTRPRHQPYIFLCWFLSKNIYQSFCRSNGSFVYRSTVYWFSRQFTVTSICIIQQLSPGVSRSMRKRETTSNCHKHIFPQSLHKSSFLDQTVLKSRHRSKPRQMCENEIFANLVQCGVSKHFVCCKLVSVMCMYVFSRYPSQSSNN